MFDQQANDRRGRRARPRNAAGTRCLRRRGCSGPRRDREARGRRARAPGRSAVPCGAPLPFECGPLVDDVGLTFERRGQSVDVALLGGAQEDLDRLVAGRAGGLELLGGSLEGGPAGQAVLESEGVLDVAQPRIRGGTRPRARQAGERVRLLRAQILQPALGFLAEMFDGITRSKRTRHETPSFRYARRPLNDGPEEGSWLTDEPAGWEVPCRGQEAPQSALPGSVRQGARGVNRQQALSRKAIHA